ncbi:MAG: glycosyltransferase family 4 protein [Bryobacteraceae bacterium]|nr:glycosyltransferase family 4 protein [Bryobacteraceae bacterium]
MSTRRPRIAFVIQRYGLEITGGSEALCRKVAEKLASHYDIEVLTSCAIDHLSWKNVLPEGRSVLNGVTIHRFPATEERHLLNFHRVYDRIFLEQLTDDQERDMIHHQGPCCPALIDRILRTQSSCDAFVFFTYLYWPTVVGLDKVKEKAIFVPTAHDETSLYLHVLDELFRVTPHLLFNSDEERFLTLRRFTLPESTGRVAGMGIDEPEPGETDPGWGSLRDRLRGNRILTYVGRVENGKGCDELVDFFLRFVREENRLDITLLLLGNRTLPLPPHPQIVSPGFVSEYVKFQALASTDIAIAPSPFESLCIAALESWMHRRPVLANGKCAVLVGHCIRSNGGLWYTSYPEFRETVKLLLSNAELRAALGKQGRGYVEQNYRWPVIEQIWRDEIDSVIASQASAKEQTRIGN